MKKRLDKPGITPQSIKVIAFAGASTWGGN